MAIQISKWIDEYEKMYEGYSVTYTDGSGQKRDDDDPRFSSISSTLQSRGRVLREELREIGRWKVEGNRIDRHLKENNPGEVERKSRAAFQSSSPDEAAGHLIKLKGVGVPVASSVLSMMAPTRFAVIDFRALRALAAVSPSLIDPGHYPTYAEFMDHFRNYNTDPDTYAFFMDEIRQVGNHHGIMPREVEMALWAYDESV